MARLEIDNLTKTFGEISLFNDLTLNVKRGEIVAVYGGSGCGKSTLLRILSGALEASSGDIRIDGHSIIDAPPEERDIGMAFQNFALYPHMNAFDNIASPLRGKKKSTADVNKKVEAIAELLKIDGVLSHFPQELSNGQRQRASLARALVAEPAVLLLDDPLRNVDAKLRYEMRLEMPDLFRRFESSVIYVTQDSREAMALADRIAILEGGRFVQVGPPQNVYESPCNTKVGRLLGDPAINLYTCQVSAYGDTLKVNPCNSLIDISKRYSVSNGYNCIVGLRPEDVRLSMSRRDENMAEGIIESITLSNIRSLLVVKTIDGEEIFASCPEQEVDQYLIKDKVYALFPQDKILLFAPDTGRLIESHQPEQE